MRYIVIFLTVLISVVSTNAVVVNCVDEGSGIVRVDYNSSDETELPRAFAMDITVDGGAVISKLYDYKVGDSSAASPGYGIFPVSMTFDKAGLVKDLGTPVVNPTISSNALGGLGTAGITVVMVSRYNASTDAPHITGTLFRILVDKRGASTVHVKAAANVSGGGIVLEDATIAKFSSIGCTIAASSPSSPSAPALLSYPTSNNTGQYVINWSSSSGAVSYQLERSANNGSTWTQVYSGAAQTFSDTVINGSYKYRVKATNAMGFSGWTTGTSNCVVSIPTPPTSPAAPASISYPATSSTGKYTISWPASSGAVSYQLERSANNGSTWTQVYSGAALTFSDTIANGSYRYHVRATNTAGFSGWRTGTGTCVVSIPKPAAPASISYPATSSTGKYTISWPASSRAVSYQLERSANNGSTWTQVYSGAAQTFSDTVINGSYKYRVKATNAMGFSGWRTGTGNCVVSIPKPAAPASISYPATSSTGKYTISWPASSGATSYQLERSANEGKSPWVRIYSGKALSWSENITSGKYFYRIKSTNSAGSSGWRTRSGYCEVAEREDN